jgi:two-component system response regulator GlrR
MSCKKNVAEANESAAKVLIVDDDPDLLHLLDLRLSVAGYQVIQASSGAQALTALQRELPQVVITDLRMEGMDGHALLANVQAIAPGIPVIMLTAHGSIPEAVAATQRGAFGFMTKPFDGKEVLALVAAALKVSPVVTPEAVGGEWRSAVIGSSPVMEVLLRDALQLAGHEDALLILGASGAGKEVLARAIWQASARANGPFVPVNCAAPHDVTAMSAKQPLAIWDDLLLKAKDGVLFLDDIAALSPVLQGELAKLLLSGNWVGSARLHTANVRVIAAALPTLERDTKDGLVRADLFYHLSAHKLVVPTLAERREDIPELITYFLRQAGSKHSFSPEALASLQAAAWPGNVRQLHSLVKQCLQVSAAPVISRSVVQRALGDTNLRDMSAFDDARRVFERDYLVGLLEATQGNVARAARTAERNRSDFYKLLARHELDPADFKSRQR